MRQSLKKKKLQNNHKYKHTQFNIGSTLSPNHQNYFQHYKRCPNRPSVTPCHKQVVFPTLFQNHEEAFLLQKPFHCCFQNCSSKLALQTLEFSQTIILLCCYLDITNSVKFKHFKLHFDHTDPTYSTCIIHKVIYPKDWGQPLHQPLSFPTHLRIYFQDFNTSYMYWDYQQAWFNAFFLQNQNHNHSWLFYFHNGMILQTSPSGSSNGGTILVVMLTPSKTILWLRMVIFISKLIFNQLLLRGSFLLFLFSI